MSGRRRFIVPLRHPKAPCVEDVVKHRVALVESHLGARDLANMLNADWTSIEDYYWQEQEPAGAQ